MRIASLWACILVSLVGCDAGGVIPPGRDGSTSDLDSTVPTRDSNVPRIDAGEYDPFDPDNACGSSAIPTERVPGSLLIVFDRSGSMDSPASGDSGPTKWDLATAGINSVLASVSDELSAGLLLFPESGECGIGSAPDVPVAPLTTSRAQIQAALSGSSPSGAGTPAFGGLLAGFDYLDTLTSPGQRGIVLVSDGQETCDDDMSDAVMARVQTEHDTKNRLTFAVGMDFADNNMSTIAFNGGTPRNTTCMPMCTSDSCRSDADCGGAPCFQPGGSSFPGFCGCRTTADCVTPQTCEETCPPFFPACGIPPTCQGEPDCCHYNVTASDFSAEFEAALDEIARRLLDSCVFDLPRGTDPTMFDPGLVNVGVTFEGEDRTVLRRSSDPAVDSWNYVDDTHESILIQGDICDRLLDGSAVVEIVLGCPTILI
ncbi:MAG: hypothetical protein SangKO_070860 [Sandaracinaceae bacterium]|nr:MAG: VWA domain-containing protein [Sandaracinaceae bacterium]